VSENVAGKFTATIRHVVQWEVFIAEPCTVLTWLYMLCVRPRNQLTTTTV